MNKNRYITGYSGLRALAVIGVILYHLDPNTFIGGYLGVPIFFVLSGYLVTDHMLKSYYQRGSYDNKRFYLSRIKRLYPQLIAVLWLSSAWIILFQRNLLAKLNQIIGTNLLNIFNFWQIQNGQSYFERFAANESPFTHLWTMSIEGQFYIFWPLIIYLLIRFVHSKKRIFWIIFSVSILSAIEMAGLYLAKVDINRIYYGTDTRFFSIGLGAALAFIWPIEQLKSDIAKSDKRILNFTGLFAFVSMLLMFFGKFMNPQTTFTYCGGMFIFSILTSLMVAIIAHPGSFWNDLLTNSIFNWLGSRSYGIYLYQFPVMIFFEDKFPDIANHVLLYRLIEIIIILLVSETSYRLIEKPMSKINWVQLKLYFVNVFSIKNKNYKNKIQVVIMAIILFLGSIAIVVAPSAKSMNFNKSQLAQRIDFNQKQEKKANQALIDKTKKKKKHKADDSQALIEAPKNSKRHIVNKSFVKYGISEIELQLAQKIDVTAIGDSVMAGSSNDLKLLMPKALIDAAVSRQLSVAYGLLDNYQKQGVLANNVLIGLGTNGPFSMDDLNQLMLQVGPKRHVFWINTHVPTRAWQGTVNNLLNQAKIRYHNLTIIDWYGYSQNHPQWFYGDQTHPNFTGSKYYSAFIVKTIVKHIKF